MQHSCTCGVNIHNIFIMTAFIPLHNRVLFFLFTHSLPCRCGLRELFSLSYAVSLPLAYFHLYSFPPLVLSFPVSISVFTHSRLHIFILQYSHIQISEYINIPVFAPLHMQVSVYVHTSIFKHFAICISKYSQIFTYVHSDEYAPIY